MRSLPNVTLPLSRSQQTSPPVTMPVSAGRYSFYPRRQLLSSSSSNLPFLSLKLLVLIGILVAAILLAACFFCFFRNRKLKQRSTKLVNMETDKVKVKDLIDNSGETEVKVSIADLKQQRETTDEKSDQVSWSGSRSDVTTTTVENIGWGRWYSLRELEIATKGFAEENVIGQGGYGVVYRAVLLDGSIVAVKNLLNNKGQAEKEFKIEVEAIGKVKHKHLVGLVGYCAEGPKRMLVYEYVENGNLEQWLHGDVTPLTWEIRMRIAVGTAKGLAYLHEGLEPKVVHRDVKSSNILVDKKWNAKISDFGLAKLLGCDASYVRTRVMGTFGYVSPEYASTGMLNEGSDVYSFGVLLMELVTGRSPVDYSRPPGEMNLVEWFKGMVGSQRGEEVVDPRIVDLDGLPSPRALKRILLVCLRCIDMDARKRPKMGQIVHMLQNDDFPFHTDHRSTRQKHHIPTRAAAEIPLPSKLAGEKWSR